MTETDSYLPQGTDNAARNYVKILEVSSGAPNIIFLMTPIVSVGNEHVKKWYEPLSNYSCNIFALDLPGIGISDGQGRDFTAANILGSIQELIRFIGHNYTGTIHLYGGTGTGGIIGQMVAASPAVAKSLKSFSQFGVAIHKDLSMMSHSRMLHIMNPILRSAGKLFSEQKIQFRIPEYTGKNAEREAEWYKKMMTLCPGCFDMKLSMIGTLLHIICSGKSPLRNPVSIPTLVIAAQHDRYFYREYYQSYYDSLKVPKKLLEIEDSHLMFDWRSDEICAGVSAWVHENDHGDQKAPQ